MTRKSRVEAWVSVSFTNYLFEFGRDSTVEQHHELQRQLMDFHSARRKFTRGGKHPPPVDFAKLALGKQDYTWIGEYRNWVWERGDWRLFVNNHQGFALELRMGTTIARARELWDDVRARFGVLDVFPSGTRVRAHDVRGVSLGPDPDHPGRYLLDLEGNKKASIHLDDVKRDQ